MSCHGCAKSFGLLNREVGCPKCKFSFCKNCLRFKYSDLKTGNKLQVCRLCSEDNSQQKYMKSELLQKLESLEQPDPPPIIVYKEGPNARRESLKKGLSKEDEAILMRLENLRQSSGGERKKSFDKNSDDELKKRLARLKGEDCSGENIGQNKSDLLLSKPGETDDELLVRLAQEVKLNDGYKGRLVDDIEVRLLKLQGGPKNVPTNQNPKISDDGNEIEMSEEDQVQRIINQYVEEVNLEKENEFKGDIHESEMEGNLSEEEDIPMEKACRICEEKRAVFKCKECDDDKFCRACFDEFHNELGEMHKPTSI